MKAALLRLVLAFVFSFGAPGLALPVQAEAPTHPPVMTKATHGVSPAGMLNVDGTLALTTASSGSLDLSGYQVTLDPMRGPVFDQAQADDGPDGVAAAPLGEWTGVGQGAGAIDDVVRAIVVNNGVAYIGGSFRDAGNIAEADYVATWDGTSWGALSSNGQGDGAIVGTVYSLAFSSGSLYVGGYFYGTYDGAAFVGNAGYLAKWDGAHWSGLGGDGAGGPSLNNSVYAIAISGSDIYVGGGFTDVNNNGSVLTAADNIARWNGSNWLALGSNGSSGGSLNSVVLTLAVSGSTVYAGGFFNDVNNNGVVLTAADYIARWDGTNWASLSSNGAGEGSVGYYVSTLALSGSTLYVGGTFTDVNNNGVVLTAADCIARWDGTNWSALGSNGAGNGALTGAVSNIWVNGTDVYVGGTFTNVNNNGTPLATADYAVKWDGANWSALGSNGSGNGAVSGKGNAAVMAFGQLGGTILAGGYFYDLNDGAIVLPGADHIAAWNGTHWSALGNVSNGSLASGYGGSRVNAILVNGTDVYVGGHFTNISNHGVNIPEADYVARWDGANWSALGSDGSGNGSLNYNVTSLAMIGTDLYVGGVFSNVNNNGTTLAAADRIARWDGTNWHALSSNGAGDGSIPGYVVVNALAVSGTTLYVGGNFTNVNDNGVVLTAADRLASWDGTHWSAVGSNGAGDGAISNGVVIALAVSGSTLVVGGTFTDVNDGGAVLGAADYIAAWDGTHWAALGDNGAGGGALNDAVFAIGVAGTTVYAGGGFSSVNDHGVANPGARYLAQWDGAHWSTVGAGAYTFNSAVDAILVNGTDVYVCGRFQNVVNAGAVVPAADFIARWDGTDWTALGVDGQATGSLPGWATTMAVRGTELLVGGYFENVRNLGTTIVPEADFIAAYGLRTAPPPPIVNIVGRGNINPVGGDIVQYIVQFSKSVTGVDVGDFAVTTTGLTGSSISSVGGSGTYYDVMVNVGTGSSGTLRLDVIDDDSILDASLQPLGGFGAGNGDFTSGQVYTIDRAYPVVLSSTRVDSNPTRAGSVQFVVTFSRSVANVDVTDFIVTANGLTGALVTAVSGSGTSYTVTVSTGSGSGTLRLDLIDDDSIRDDPFNALGGTGNLNGNYTSGETYDVRNRWIYLPELQRGS